MPIFQLKQIFPISLIILSSINQINAVEQCASLYGQCGGLNWNGPNCCTGGYLCSSQNPYYHQCTPIKTTTATSTATAPTIITLPTTTNPVFDDSECAALWGQCGGRSWNGPTCCQDSYPCQSVNDYYYQCTTSVNTDTQCASSYAQCGGVNWNGPTCCHHPHTCQYVNNYYHQCTSTLRSPKTTTTSATTLETTTTSSSATTTTFFSSTSTISTPQTLCALLYGQCGGLNWSGPECCQSPFSCSSHNPYYHQCTTTASTTSATTNTQNPTSTNTNTFSTLYTAAYNSTESQPTSPTNSDEVFTVIPSGASGSGVTTRYWDCCKPSCSWNGKADVSHPVHACAADGFSILDVNAQSACTGGSAFPCNNQQPWAVSDSLAYGFAAVALGDGDESKTCCACYKLTFTSSSIAGKTMIVQVTNTGDDLAYNQFDIALPGGGMGYFSGCPVQYGSDFSWGQQYGGISSQSECAGLPESLESGCDFRFDWFEGASNPDIDFERVVCPAELVAKSGCSRNDE
ncbi:glycoside hydrolase family 45 protein [Ascoidea rubescens DSM 1968]|uniref:Cellulase n=1 Tax=Ascoidea rubescens DSM 1968 TaxID=1344418 RepID=A0A1D2VQW1_9ASCO|nr:glycoside hydrolase family 45 protein [Ascoidea rubescens DSM 1968]ODV63994.1 glycoside hydrolase family 45 protein [Ascoidea rubescens DSM 1968]